MSRKDKVFEVTILAQYCKGCGLCVEVCTQGKLSVNPQPNKQGIQTAAADDQVPCTGCLKCTLICPDAAIEIRQLTPAAAELKKDT